ncbi:MAG: hypothetical protein C0508_09520 [Cyanobacteria bacterium PR.023]|nr:hypothetical protein [Cyanobacteria bacterium PR.023]
MDTYAYSDRRILRIAFSKPCSNLSAIMSAGSAPHHLLPRADRQGDQEKLSGNKRQSATARN